MNSVAELIKLSINTPEAYDGNTHLENLFIFHVKSHIVRDVDMECWDKMEPIYHLSDELYRYFYDDGA